MEPVRADKWLWAARLVKTRALAAEAIKGGRVAVNDQRIKPSRDLRPGDRLQLTLPHARIEVVVRALSDRRGPAVEAQKLYEETQASRDERERRAEERRLAAVPLPQPGARPTKRDRRRFEESLRRSSRG